MDGDEIEVKNLGVTTLQVGQWTDHDWARIKQETNEFVDLLITTPKNYGRQMDDDNASNIGVFSDDSTHRISDLDDGDECEAVNSVNTNTKQRFKEFEKLKLLSPVPNTLKNPFEYGIEGLLPPLPLFSEDLGAIRNFRLVFNCECLYYSQCW
eukprot:Platyproteum_vivax@DN9153_c0_g1_i1.p1